MTEATLKVDLSKSPSEHDNIHNRWHPDIPMVTTVEPGSELHLECMDWTGGQIDNNDSAADVRDVDLTEVHYLTGPIGVKGAEPGDLLVVDILDLGAFPEQQWGFNGMFAYENGGGFLTDLYPEARKSIWDFHGIYAKSRHVPGVEFTGLMHPGLVGTLPSRELLEDWNKREQALIDTEPNRTLPLAAPPYAGTAHMGRMPSDKADEAAQEAARTVPPREHGGNCDIKDLTKGSRVYFPVYVPEGGLSMGDLHFSQGDGEITFCGAIEMAGWIRVRVNLIKDGVRKYAVRNPIFKPSTLQPEYKQHLIFEGISVTDTGEQRFLDAHLSYRQACVNAIEYLKQFGYSGAQGYAILGTAPVQGHISGIVDVPNACATVCVPTEIFDFDINPSESGPTKMAAPDDIPMAPWKG